jgi:hypothetical protein
MIIEATVWVIFIRIQSVICSPAHLPAKEDNQNPQKAAGKTHEDTKHKNMTMGFPPKVNNHCCLHATYKPTHCQHEVKAPTASLCISMTLANPRKLPIFKREFLTPPRLQGVYRGWAWKECGKNAGNVV